MYNKVNSNQTPRYPKAYISSFGNNFIHFRSPWVSLWLSALFPGFGQLYLGRSIKGYLLIIWEIIINIKAHLNDGIIYSFIGQFDKAKMVIDRRWLLLYVGVYMYSIWDSYKTTVDFNKINLLAERENARYKPFEMKLFDIYYLDKRNPWVAIAWSIMMPGLGHLYTHKFLTGVFILTSWIIIAYLSNFVEAIYLTAYGNFHQVIPAIDHDWLLFMPSIHTFTIYDSYINVVENNKLFELEQANYLRDNYQDSDFEMPI